MDSCLGEFCFFICFFLLWVTCMAIGDACNISPLYVLLGFVIFGVVAWLILNLATTWEEKRLERKRDLCRSIQKNYPHAYYEYCYKNNINTYSNLSKENVDRILVVSEHDWDCREKEILEDFRKSLEKQGKAEIIKNTYAKGYEIWSKDNQKATPTLIINSETEIAKIDSLCHTAEMYEKWEQSQESFNDTCYDLSKKHFPEYGRYYYDLNWQKQNEKGDWIPGKYRVWQFFADSLCLDVNLDYTNCPNEKESFNQIPEFMQCSRFFTSRIYDMAIAYIEAIAESSKNSTCVVFNDHITGWSERAFNFHYKYIRERIKEKNINAYNFSFLLEQNNMKSESIPSIEKVIIFDIYTENSALFSNCGDLLDIFGDRTLISYISMLKCYDSEEMQERINEANKKELRKKLLLEAKLAKEIKEREAKKNLKEKVKDWHLIKGVLRYNYLLNYYPTTCEFEANDEEWDDRYTVWNFKNTPGKTDEDDHQATLDDVIPRIKSKLCSTFGESSLKYLTLVCIPASSSVKTELRYKEFSERLCEETGMENAYSHLSVTKASEEKKFGGHGIMTNNISFDEDFFKGKYVLLFDDVITKGESMLRFKLKMERLGAIVVCGFSIGKTKHERN